MKLSRFTRTGYLLAALAIAPGVSLATQPKMCKPGAPTSESYTWDFAREASGLLAQTQADALRIEDLADTLRTFAQNPTISWQSHADQLTQIKQEVNDMGAKLCRLETIRGAALPWQQQAIDRTALRAREMANNTVQAINYLNSNLGHFWAHAYRQYATNLYNESQQLSGTVLNYEHLAKVRREERQLEKALHTPQGA